MSGPYPQAYPTSTDRAQELPIFQLKGASKGTANYRFLWIANTHKPHVGSGS